MLGEQTRMEIGLFAPLASPMADRAYLATLGSVAEECGFETLWLAWWLRISDWLGRL